MCFCFSFLDHCPPGIIYTVMCFAVRMTEGLGAAAYGTANFAMMAYTFPDNVATMFVSIIVLTLKALIFS